MSTSIDAIRRRALRLPHRVILVDGEDERTIEAAVYLRKHGLLEPVLVGDSEVVRSRLAGKHVGVELEVVNPHKDQITEEFAECYTERLHKRGKVPPQRSVAKERLKDPSYFAAMMLETGRVDGLVGGSALPTAHILKAALECVGLNEERGVVSGAFAMFLPNPLPSGQNVLMFADCAVVPDPDAERLAAIATNTVKVTERVLGIDPMVAFLSFSTKGSASHDLVDKVVRAVEISRKRLPNTVIDGELQVDTALMPEVAERKAPNSVLGGNANILLFPDLNSGNIAYKLVERLARAEALGVILEGFSKPVNDLSRGCSVQSVIDMVCVTALQATFDPGMRNAALREGRGV